MRNESTSTRMNRIVGIVGMMVVVFSVIFLIIVVLYHALILGFGGNRNFYGFDFMTPLYVSGVNLLIPGKVLDEGSFGKIARPHYGDFFFFMCGLNVLAFGVILFSFVLLFEQFQGLPQETFFWPI